MNIRRNIALVLGVTLLSSVGAHNKKAYAAEFNKPSKKIVSSQEKLIGSERYETAIEVSKKGWANGATNAVLVNNLSVVDALSATPFANAKDAPILLTQKDKLNEKTKEQLKKLGVKNVYIIGGENVISKKVEDELKAQNIKVDRIQGANREATSLEIAKRLDSIKPITEVSIVNGYKGLADAVSIAAVAANKDMPIILSKADGVSEEITKFIKSKNIKTSYIIGGESVISKKLDSKVPNANRIAGLNRKDTNAKVIDTFYENNELENIYVTKDGAQNENQLIDALSVGSLAAKNNSPVMLVSNNLSDTQKDIINTKSFKTVTQVGGNGNEKAFNELSDIQKSEVYNVSTIDELNNAIAKSNANDTIIVKLNKNSKANQNINIKTNKKISLTLQGNIDNTIKISSPNLKLINEGTVKNIVVEGNNKVNSINLINNGKIESLTINDNAKVKLDNSSSITNLQINKNASNVQINNSGNIQKLKDESSKATITGQGSINKPEKPEEVKPVPPVENGGSAGNEEEPVEKPTIPATPIEPSTPNNGENNNEEETVQPPEETEKPEEPVQPSEPEKGEEEGGTQNPSESEKEEEGSTENGSQEPNEPNDGNEQDGNQTPETPNKPENGDASEDNNSNENDSDKVVNPELAKKMIDGFAKIPAIDPNIGYNKGGVGDSVYRLLSRLCWTRYGKQGAIANNGKLIFENAPFTEDMDAQITFLGNTNNIYEDMKSLFVLKLMTLENDNNDYEKLIKAIHDRKTTEITNAGRKVKVEVFEKEIRVTFYNMEGFNNDINNDTYVNPSLSELVEFFAKFPSLDSSTGKNKNGVGDSTYETLKRLGWETENETSINKDRGTFIFENKNGVDGIDAIVKLKISQIDEDDMSGLFILRLMMGSNSEMSYQELIEHLNHGSHTIVDGSRIIEISYNGLIDNTVTLTFYNYGSFQHLPSTDDEISNNGDIEEDSIIEENEQDKETVSNEDLNDKTESEVEKPAKPESDGNMEIRYPEVLPKFDSKDGKNINGVADSAYELLSKLGWKKENDTTVSANYGRVKLENKNGKDNIDGIVTMICDSPENDRDNLALLGLMMGEDSKLSYEDLIKAISNGSQSIVDGDRIIEIKYNGRLDYTITVTFYNYGTIPSQEEVPTLNYSDGINPNGVGDSAYEILKQRRWEVINESTLSINGGEVKLENRNGENGIDAVVTMKKDAIENNQYALFLLRLMVAGNNDANYKELVKAICNGPQNMVIGNRLIKIAYDNNANMVVTFYNAGIIPTKEEVPTLNSSEGTNSAGFGDSTYEILKQRRWEVVDSNTLTTSDNKVKFQNKNGKDGIDAVIELKADLVENNPEVLFMLRLMYANNDDSSFGEFIENISNGYNYITIGDRKVEIINGKDIEGNAWKTIIFHNK